MAIQASQLIEKMKTLSPEEQEEIAQRMEERISSMFKQDLVESIGKNFLSGSQPLQGLAQSALSKANLNLQGSLGTSIKGALQSIQEATNLSLSNLLKGCAADMFKASFGISERYYGPAFIPPSFYPKQKPPQIINMYIIYLSVSNIPVHFLFLLVKRTR
jgi:hypothetical protein